MKIIRVICLSIATLVAGLSRTYAQCDIQNKIYADGTMYHFVTPVTFYFDSNKKLEAGIITDNENYFIALAPRPFPPRSESKKLKKDILLTLSNRKEYTLRFYDIEYAPGDTSMKLTYRFDNKDIPDMMKLDAVKIVIDLGKGGDKTYMIRHRKALLREQLTCLYNRAR